MEVSLHSKVCALLLLHKVSTATISRSCNTVMEKVIKPWEMREYKLQSFQIHDNNQ